MVKVDELIARCFSKDSSTFSVVVSNPPYQTEAGTMGGHNSVMNVFQHFQDTADLIAERSCMVYPGERWVHQSGKGMREFGHAQLNSPSLRKVVFFPFENPIFGNSVKVFDGVTIVYKHWGYTGKGPWLLERHSATQRSSGVVDPPGDQLPSTFPEINTIISKVRANSNNDKRLSSRIMPRDLFGIESSFAEDNPDKVVLCNDDFNNEPIIGDWVKIFTNDLGGGGGRSTTRWFYIQRHDIPKGLHMLDSWKVICSSVHLTGGDSSSPLVDILESGTAHGRARVIVGAFNTREEAVNFFNWLKTPLIRTLLYSSGNFLGSFGKNTPDLGDYTCNNPVVDFNTNVSELNDQLCELYGLDENDRIFLKNFSSKLPPMSRAEYTNE